MAATWQRWEVAAPLAASRLHHLATYLASVYTEHVLNNISNIWGQIVIYSGRVSCVSYDV